ncbi:hypothetical protein, partial [Chromobacterium violaceum]
ASPADMAHIAAANPAAVQGLLADLEAMAQELLAYRADSSLDTAGATIRAQAARIAELERDAARYRAMRDGLVSGDLENNPIGEAMYELGERVCRERGHDAIPTAAEFDAAIDTAMKQPTCTCPSGDGSLSWPCPQHPPEVT